MKEKQTEKEIFVDRGQTHGQQGNVGAESVKCFQPLCSTEVV